MAEGTYALADPLSARAVKIYEKILGPNHPELATALENRSLLLRKMKREDEAEELEARVKAIRAKAQ